ncbi:MASE4 domain-containing protein [Skermanella mucosa]|uniref:MASE4 domain-containing protein n=1 Tax=Skermanella mucosa TaxID=1789672 RepID=UPI00192BF007|nr:MASE4 domain-containing protein [Skermanella mucosa]UEM19754.1 MASE4 domain-containing protein [Skermanella mucosa]
MRPPRRVQGDHPFLLSTSPPTRNQERLAVCVLAVLVAELLVTAPFARIPLPGTEILLPAYGAAILLIELITSALLLALFSVQHSRAVLVLAIGYLFSGLMVVPWMLTFPGVFEALGLDAGLQVTASIAALRRLGFPLFVLAYALLKDGPASEPRFHGSVPLAIVGSVAGAFAAAGMLTWFILANDDSLPNFMRNARNVTGLWSYIPAMAIFLYLTALAVLFARRRSVLDLWLMVVLCTLLIEIILLSYVSAGIRLSVGWWGGRSYGLASASMVLLVLLSESTTLYARVARSVSAERRARETRLTAMEALSALIAHEINQPLASMVTNADAGLRWLEKENPDPAEAQAALRRIVNDGHRAGRVIESIRAMFKKEARDRVPLDVNRLIEEVLARCRDDVRLGRVTVETALEPGLPTVTGNPIQLQQVLSNLVSNAIDAMCSVTGRARVLRVTSRSQAPGEVMVSVEDSGPGVGPELRGRIFEPFFTTKPDGMGMGLMFCRLIIESGGGRLWADGNVPHGAVFRFTLPGSDDGVWPVGEQAR